MLLIRSPPAAAPARCRPRASRKLTHLAIRAAAEKQQDAAPTTTTPSGWSDRLRAAFDAADADGNGVIDKSELRALLESTAGGLECPLPGAPDPRSGAPPPSSVHVARGWLPEADVQAVLAQYDADGDGSIDFGEYARLAADGLLLQGRVAEYAAAFAALDTGGNGRLGPTEVADLMRGLGRPLDYEALVALMRDFDTDASGQLEFGEFLRMCRSFLSLDEILAYMRLAPTEAAVQEAAAAASGTKPAAAPPAAPAAAAGVVDGMADLFSSADLDAALAAAGPAGATVLLSSVTWCRPCRAMAAPIKKLAAAYGPGTPSGVGFFRVYGNASEGAKALFRDRLGTRATPTWFIFVGAGPEPVHTHTGANKARLEHAIREAVAGARGEGALPGACLYPPEPKPTGGW